MSTVEDQMKQMTAAMEKMTAQFGAMASTEQAREAKDKEFAQRLSAMEDRLSAAPQFSSEALMETPGPLMSQASFPQVNMHEDWKKRPLTGEEVGSLIQHALQHQVKPVMQQVYTQLDQRLAMTEREVATLKMRVAWTEKDLLQSQIQVAKRTAIFRSWPDHYTEQDRRLTIRKAFKAADVSSEYVDIYTGSFMGDDNVKKLSGNSIVSTVAFTDRQSLINTHRDHDASFTACPGWKWIEVTVEE